MENPSLFNSSLIQAEDKYNKPGMGPLSGICAKKRWAESCGGVPWDGITNNEDVCYKVN